MNAKSAECKCEPNFTCRHCLEIAAERNMADRNNAPLAWTNNPTEAQIREANRRIIVRDFPEWLTPNA
jgi:hypothetical protein